MPMAAALLQEVARVSAPAGGLTPFAALFMTVSMGSVTLLAAYLFYRILRAPMRQGDEAQGPAK